MSQKQIPFDSHLLLPQKVRKALADNGPLTSKQIVRHVRQNDSPQLKSSAVRKVLDHTIANEIQRLPGNTYTLLDNLPPNKSLHPIAAAASVMESRSGGG